MRLLQPAGSHKGTSVWTYCVDKTDVGITAAATTDQSMGTTRESGGEEMYKISERAEERGGSVLANLGYS